MSKRLHDLVHHDLLHHDEHCSDVDNVADNFHDSSSRHDRSGRAGGDQDGHSLRDLCV